MATYFIIAVIGLAVVVITLLLDDFHLDFGHDHDHESPWSVRALALFLVGFGAVGYLGMYFGWSAIMAAGPGLVTGVIFGWVSIKMTSALEATAGNSVSSLHNLVGRRGRVIDTIAVGNSGEVEISDEFGHTQYVRAVAARQIAPGTLVQCKGVIGNTIEVE